MIISTKQWAAIFLPMGRFTLLNYCGVPRNLATIQGNFSLMINMWLTTVTNQQCSSVQGPTCVIRKKEEIAFLGQCSAGTAFKKSICYLQDSNSKGSDRTHWDSLSCECPGHVLWTQKYPPSSLDLPFWGKSLVFGAMSPMSLLCPENWVTSCIR